MPKELMSDQEIRRRKKLQAAISQTTGTLGLAALGGTMVASRGGRRTLRKIPQLKSRIKAPPPRDPNRDHIKAAVTPVLATGAGIGGIGAFNFAAYTRAESKKRQRQKTTTAKRLEDDMDMGYFGEEGHPITLPDIPPVEVTKAWEPVASNFDSERSRQKRSSVYQGAALAGAGGAGVYSARQGFLAHKTKRKMKGRKPPPTRIPPMKSKLVGDVEFKESGGRKRRRISESAETHYKAIPEKQYKANKKAVERKIARHDKAVKVGRGARKVHTRNAAIGAGAAGLGIGTSMAIGHKRKTGSWSPYAKSATSAFGIDHSLDIAAPTEWTAP